ncbi:50S ribosomal protein L6 [Wickerhamomyces ciferrii]|uniref:50S ribosomal protein L6 n=1 Tax=Wickerhamomyces ciferrii (strain ATCC 14091 / BCRC 22168 / CBS 111 / JCM 3599 / NBRC 0793 / NRRL Y-1031 F-60-10) TaxID=1206466 RepID=K0KQ61_WICCF|nr:50S ribosomal protein L6 [Wickerhamomyces ciferrii]CCH43343.1 50S ribosomal protein L6 [Wickerhamomyces ciferrii]
MFGLRSSIQFSKRLFSTSVLRPSYIGSAPIYIPEDVKIEFFDREEAKIIRKGRSVLNMTKYAKVTGPKGELQINIPDFLKYNTNADKLLLSVENDKDKQQKALWGTTRAVLNNHVTGVTEGHVVLLKLVGTGYRAQVEERPDGPFVTMKVGASIPQGLYVPKGLTVSSPVPTRIIVEGADKQQVLLFAANLRKFRPPEPYKGKGVYVGDETIKIKDKKIK